MQCGLIGEKLGHSFSKEIHTKLANYTYELKELAPEQIDGFLRAKDFRGINVTIPYKQTVIPYLDFISDTAKKIGVVNAVVNREGKLYGYNTDYYGLKALLEREGICLQGKKVLILGSGGTSGTALAVAKDGGAADIYRVSRSKKEGCITYDEALQSHSDARIIINTTPLGMYPHIEGCALDIDGFAELEAVVDAIYNPLCSRLVLSAKAKGLKAAGGLYMLVMQAAKAVELFSDAVPEPAKIEKIYQSLLSQKQNIVLIGMPTSGKSTVGKALAAKLGRRFVDTDELLAQKVSMSTGDYMNKVGESAFRDAESEVVSLIAGEQGLVIATGGGAILRQCNVTALKHNGVLLFLDRPPQALCAALDRPLSSTREALQQRYKERYPLYMAAADVHIAVPDGVEKTVDIIIKEWEK